MFAPFLNFFKNLGQNVGQGVNKMIRPENGARTPSFVPDSVGKDLGRSGGGVLPLADAVPDIGIIPRPNIAAPAAPSTMRGIVPENIPGRAMPATAPESYRPPRLAERDIRAEIDRRRSDPNSDVIYDEPYGREKMEYILRKGDPREAHRGWKAGFSDFFQGGRNAVRELPPGADVGQVLGTFLGGGTGSSIAGKVNPIALEERNFESEELPRLYRNQTIRNEQARADAEIGYRQAQAQADRDKAEREKAKLEWEMKQPIKTERGMMRPDETIIEGTAPLPTPRPPVSMGGVDYLWNAQTGKYEPNIVNGSPTRSTNTIIADKNIQSREKIAGQTDERQRAIAAMNEGGRRTRHESGSSKPGQSGTLYQKWATMRKKALNEDGALSQEEVNAAVVQMNEAAEQLRNDPSFEVSGEGGWSWVKPRQGGQSQGGKRILMSKLKQHGLSREAAEAAGYTVVDQ